jgi:hypothetical protein
MGGNTAEVQAEQEERISEDHKQWVVSEDSKALKQRERHTLQTSALHCVSLL